MVNGVEPLLTVKLASIPSNETVTVLLPGASTNAPVQVALSTPPSSVSGKPAATVCGPMLNVTLLAGECPLTDTGEMVASIVTTSLYCCGFGVTETVVKVGFGLTTCEHGDGPSLPLKFESP